MRYVAAVLFALMLALASSSSQDPPSTPSDFPEPFALERWSVDGGGGFSFGGSYGLHGIVGQPDDGSMTSGGYVLQGGFFHAPDPRSVFSDDFESGTTDRWSATVSGTMD